RSRRPMPRRCWPRRSPIRPRGRRLARPVLPPWAHCAHPPRTGWPRIPPAGTTLARPGLPAWGPLRAPAADGLAAHPAGQLGVRQSALPLGVDITHVGAAAIAPDRFDITTLTVNGTAAPLAEARAPFAAGGCV